MPQHGNPENGTVLEQFLCHIPEEYRQKLGIAFENRSDDDQIRINNQLEQKFVEVEDLKPNELANRRTDVLERLLLLSFPLYADRVEFWKTFETLRIGVDKHWDALKPVRVNT